METETKKEQVKEARRIGRAIMHELRLRELLKVIKTLDLPVCIKNVRDRTEIPENLLRDMIHELSDENAIQTKRVGTSFLILKVIEGSPKAL